MASLEPTTVVPLKGNGGSGRDLQPVAMRMSLVPGAFDGAKAADIIDFVLLEKKLDPPGKAVGHLARAADDAGPIVRKPFDFEAELGGFVG
jgi:hypothetical protein